MKISMNALLSCLMLAVALPCPVWADEALRARTQEALDAASAASVSGAVRGLPDVGGLPSRGSIDVAKIAETYRKLERPKSDTGLMVFVSHSMPKASLMRLARDARRAGGVLVFRGVSGGIGKQGWLKSMEAMKPLTDTGVSVQINPDLFRSFGVNQVPTFVLTEPGSRGCEEASACKSKLIASGDASLGYVLDRWSDNAGALGRDAAKRLANLEAGR